MKKVIKLKESDLVKMVKKIMTEDFEEGFKKPGMLGRFKQHGRDFLSAFGVDTSNKEDKSDLERIKMIIKKHPNLVKSVRKKDDNILTAWINNKSLIIDKDENNPEIIYNGKELVLADLGFESKMLYSELEFFRERD